MIQRLDQVLQSCTVQITVPGQTGWGTGFFVAPGLILTCAHVVQPAQNDSIAVVYPQEGQRYLATLDLDAAASRAVDLALLRLVDPIAPHPCVYLDDAIALHDRLYSYGYPDDFAEGAFTTFESEALTGGNAFIKFKAGQVRPGMSGSPLLNQTTGKVCGIVKFTRDRSIDLGGGAIPTSVILQQFPQLRELQREFHERDRRWSELLESVVADFDDLLERIEEGTATPADLQRLREVLVSRPAQMVQLGKYNINLGQGENIQIGDRTYVEIDEAAIAAIVAAIRPSADPAPIQGIPHNLPRTGAAEFVGRDAALRELHQRLQQHERVAITAIAGMGGVGKSELALRYATEHLKQRTYPAGMCWLEVQELEVGTKLVQLATSWFNLVPPDNLDLPGQVQFCWQRWAAGDTLIIFDGLNTAADYERIVPYLPPTDARFRVLMTTRERIGAPVVRLDLDVLKPRAALQLLESLLGRERLRQEPWIARQLCRRLGYLPLGLELVGRYLAQEEDLSLAEMTEQLEAEGLTQEALAERDPRMTAKRGAEAAFELSWKALTPEAQQLSYLLSLFAPVTIPWSLLERCLEEEQQRTFKKARRALLTLSLLERQGEGAYRLHPLIRDFFGMKRQAQEQIDSSQIDTLKQQFCQGMVAVAQEIPETPTREQISAVTDTIPHLVEAATTWKDRLTDDSLITLYIGLGRFYQGQGLYAQAQPWWSQCLDYSRKRLGEEHPDVASSLSHLAELYWSQGRYSKAEPLFLKALELYKRLLGEEHPDVATSLNNLALLYWSQGRYSEAEPLYLKALELRQRLLGEEHPDVATSLNNLALLYRSQGRYSEAEPLYLKALELYKRLLGEDHPNVGRCLDNLGMLQTAQGKQKEAEASFIAALDILEQGLGAEHSWTVRCRENLEQLHNRSG